MCHIPGIGRLLRLALRGRRKEPKQPIHTGDERAQTEAQILERRATALIRISSRCYDQLPRRLLQNTLLMR